MIAGTLEATAGRSRGAGTPVGLLAAFGGGNRSGDVDVAACLVAKGQKCDFEVETFVAHALRADGFDASEDGTGRGTPLVPVQCFDARQSDVIQYGDRTGPLDTDGHTMAVAQPIRFSAKDHGADAQIDLSPTLRAGGFTESHANAGVMPAVAFDMRGREGGAQFEGPRDTANIRASNGGPSRSYVAQQWAVRRLTPTECARLQGFPDDYLALTGAADGPQYKALGNSKAVPVVRWIGRRIAAVDVLLATSNGAARD